MLKVLFLNDGTGDPPEIVGNYKYKVMINERILEEGSLKGHDRRNGWMGLVRCFAEQVCTE